MITKDPNPGLEGHVFPSPVDAEAYMVMLVYKNGSLTREGSVVCCPYHLLLLLLVCIYIPFKLILVISNSDPCLNCQMSVTVVQKNHGIFSINFCSKRNL